MRDGMAIYLSGMLLVTAGIELMLALLLASQGKVPAPTAGTWIITIGANVAMFATGGYLALWGLLRLRSGGTPRSPEAVSPEPPAS